MKYIHLMMNEKFIMPYIKFLDKNFIIKEHFFFILNGVDFLEVDDKDFIRYYSRSYNNNIIKLLYMISVHFLIYIKLIKCKKVLVHGLFNPVTTVFLFLNPWILKKSNWIIWGGDLYKYPNKKDCGVFKKIFYKIENYVKGNFSEYTIHIEGDYKLAQKLFGAKGKYNNCFMYLSNVYQEKNIKIENKQEIWIQIGNSAVSTNNHLEILDKLEKYKSENIKLFCPLSYGDKLWANKVIKYGKNIFGEKFIPITEFMKFEDYMEFIANIDIAIFAHDRQQAVGNITSLLGMEKTVYLKKEVTTYEMLKDLGIKVGDFSELNNLDLFSIEDRKKNKEIIKERFSEKRLLEDLKKIFDN